MDKKKEQLGMNPSTASGRLLKDLLFDFAIKAGHVCYRCNKPLDRETFSIEHIVPWLDSENPIELFFNLDNIGYSHLLCNVSFSRGTKGIVSHRKGNITHGISGYRRIPCRCEVCVTAYSNSRKDKYIRLKT